MAEPVLVISNDIVGERMAGPGVRYANLARVLGQSLPVILAVPEGSSPDVPSCIKVFVYRSLSDPVLEQMVRRASVVLVPACVVADCAVLGECRVPLVVDGYDPVIAESLFLGQSVMRLRHNLGRAYWLGDFFLCASERQRDWWLGLLEAHDRVNAYTFRDSPSLRRLVDVVPFGLLAEPIEYSRPVIKGVWGGISPTDKLVLWGGGLWPWLDPQTAVRAMAEVHQQRSDVKLVFPGTIHPNPAVRGAGSSVERVAELARDLGILDRAVYLGEWVPYKDWHNVLAESDVALTLHTDTLETRLSFRTRVIDYIWAGLPTVATRGDATSEIIKSHQLGILVDSEDASAVARAILDLIEWNKGQLRERSARVRESLSWEKVAEPLVRFCHSPYQAPDKPYLGQSARDPAQSEIARLEALVKGYEQGRFIRFMRWLHRLAWQIGLRR